MTSYYSIVCSVVVCLKMGSLCCDYVTTHNCLFCQTTVLDAAIQSTGDAATQTSACVLRHKHSFCTSTFDWAAKKIMSSQNVYQPMETYMHRYMYIVNIYVLQKHVYYVLIIHSYMIMTVMWHVTCEKKTAFSKAANHNQKMQTIIITLRRDAYYMKISYRYM